MSSSISAPWLKEFVVDLLTIPQLTNEGVENGGGDSDTVPQRRAVSNYTVQVIAVFEEARMLVVSDRIHKIAAFMTPQCYQKFTADWTISSIKYGLVKLVSYCLSTVSIAAANQHLGILSRLGVSFPLCVQCIGLEFVGGDDLMVMGQPIDINRDEGVMRLSQSFRNYDQLVQVISTKQFPREGQLPEFDGDSFRRPENHSMQVPLTLAVARIPDDQKRIIEGLHNAKYHHGATMFALPALYKQVHGEVPDWLIQYPASAQPTASPLGAAGPSESNIGLESNPLDGDVFEGAECFDLTADNALCRDFVLQLPNKQNSSAETAIHDHNRFTTALTATTAAERDEEDDGDLMTGPMHMEIMCPVRTEHANFDRQLFTQSQEIFEESQCTGAATHLDFDTNNRLQSILYNASFLKDCVPPLQTQANPESQDSQDARFSSSLAVSESQTAIIQTVPTPATGTQREEAEAASRSIDCAVDSAEGCHSVDIISQQQQKQFNEHWLTQGLMTQNDISQMEQYVLADIPNAVAEKSAALCLPSTKINDSEVQGQIDMPATVQDPAVPAASTTAVRKLFSQATSPTHMCYASQFLQPLMDDSDESSADKRQKHNVIVVNDNEAHNLLAAAANSNQSQDSDTSQVQTGLPLVNDHTSSVGMDFVHHHGRGKQRRAVIAKRNLLQGKSLRVSSGEEGQYVGREVRKEFIGHGLFDGVVKSYYSPYYRVVYSDGDEEELDVRELRKILLPLINATAAVDAAAKDDKGYDAAECEALTQPQILDIPINDQKTPTEHQQQQHAPARRSSTRLSHCRHSRNTDSTRKRIRELSALLESDKSEDDSSSDSQSTSEAKKHDASRPSKSQKRIGRVEGTLLEENGSKRQLSSDQVSPSIMKKSTAQKGAKRSSGSHHNLSKRRGHEERARQAAAPGRFSITGSGMLRNRDENDRTASAGGALVSSERNIEQLRRQRKIENLRSLDFLQRFRAAKRKIRSQSRDH